MTRNLSYISRNVPIRLLVDELEAYEEWGCMRELKNPANSCTHVEKSFTKWCPSCRAWALLAYHEGKIPTTELREAVAKYLADWGIETSK